MQEKALPATLPISPLEGEMAGRPEGGAKELNLTDPAIMNAIRPFATINAQRPAVVYFAHNGCDLPRVAIAAAKADNASPSEQGEKP
ncbi:hypothetical protein MPLB_650026 [Mesorhizobium sp. ORS 3324]|nr:hypothetical protein MPLB_650026 [Mesorhizobium sp. ORS 3324]